MQTITVIGGSGFVGSSFCRELAARSIPFEIIDIKVSRAFPEKHKFADIRNIASLRETIRGDIVVHLAAVHRDDIRDKTEYYRTNVQGTRNIAQVCSEQGIKKIIFTSSVAVYGFAKPGTGEDGPINPFNDYGRTKFEAEKILQSWRLETGNSLIIIRPTVIFGEGNRGNVFNLLDQIASGRFVMIGPGTNRKSMAYISNISAFLVSCVNTSRTYGLFNYVDTPDINMNTLIRQARRTLKSRDTVGPRIPFSLGLAIGYVSDAVAKITKTKFPISAVRVKKFCASTAFSSAKTELDDFRPPYTLQDGLSRTIHSEFLSPDPSREIFYTE